MSKSQPGEAGKVPKVMALKNGVTVHGFRVQRFVVNVKSEPLIREPEHTGFGR